MGGWGFGQTTRPRGYGLYNERKFSIEMLPDDFVGKEIVLYRYLTRFKKDMFMDV